MFGGISIWQLLIVLAILILILGGAVKGFKEAVDKDDKAEDEKVTQHKVIDADVKKDDKSA